MDYRSSGVILDLRPVVRDQGIDLTVFQQISSFAATTTGVNTSPTLQKREITTTVGVRDGEMVVLGGLSDERSTEARTVCRFFRSGFTRVLPLRTKSKFYSSSIFAGSSSLSDLGC